jgi:hypothetical protein
VLSPNQLPFVLGSNTNKIGAVDEETIRVGLQERNKSVKNLETRSSRPKYKNRDTGSRHDPDLVIVEPPEANRRPVLQPSAVLLLDHPLRPYYLPHVCARFGFRNSCRAALELEHAGPSVPQPRQRAWQPNSVNTTVVAQRRWSHPAPVLGLCLN